MIRNGEIKELRILGEAKGAEIGSAVLLEIDHTLYIPIHDHQGSLVTLFSMTGTCLSTHRYTAFGETSNGFSPWGFASKRYDPETGLIYFGKRYYNPNLGRWITCDPQGFQDGPNLYAYVFNNPLLYCDPYGLLAQSFAEARNLGEVCGRLWYCAWRTVEWVSHNLLPLPGIRDLIEGTCRWASGREFYQPRERPCIYSTSGIQLPHMSTPYLNGILTNKKAGTNQAEKISKEYGGIQVDLLFNPSDGLIFDFVKCIISKCGIKMAYDYMGANYFAEKIDADPKHQFNANAHSHGTTRLNNIGKILTPDQCQHISVDAYGSATIIPKGRFKDVHNYASRIDCVVWSSTWSFVKNVVGVDSSITFLTPSSMNPLTEHFLFGDTYGEQIKENGRNFAEKYLYAQ